MSEELAKFLSNQLYPDLKIWISSIARHLNVPIKKANAPVFKNPADVLHAIKSNVVSVDEWITLECKPSMFGPFLRDHFISPIVGHRSDMRLGPEIQSNDLFLAITAQITSHLKPVGIYPPINENLYQICLYPSDSATFGMIGFVPGINKIAEYLPAICSQKHLTFSNVPCNVRGIIRQIDPKSLMEIGLPIEKYEELRQSGNLWFLDLANEDAEVNPIGNVTTTEIWGGMYANGHLEILSGEIRLQPLIDGMAEIFRAEGFQPHVSQNQADRREITVYGKGIRAVIETQNPLYSIHMDAELALNYSANRAKFDRITESYLNVIEESSKLDSCEIGNLHDLDFTYSDSSSAYSVLRSASADLIADPIAIAMRDWHRKRSTKQT